MLHRKCVIGLSNNKMYSKVALLLVILGSAVNHIQGHGRLIDPPSRASAWRYGFNTPANYNDNQLYCGGKQVSV